MARVHKEQHAVSRIGWLRASVLGANDGVVSTASLIAGVAAASADKQAIMLAGLAGLVAGALSMAAGEYVSVSSQADAENADLDRERAELVGDPAGELEELAGIYRARGLDPQLAQEVARELMDRDALAAHARDELGINEHMLARPIQAAVASAASFSVGAAVPLLAGLLLPGAIILPGVILCSLLALTVLGVLGARAGGAPVLKATVRVVFWGAAAMALTAGVGALFGTTAA
ncbi:MAG: VIT family protein [Sphingomonadales bacterium]|nr:VIT family protein [Sphingomonadales bacterium]MBD3774995.1 VIT family protein [Paracoccaceae bacterium]